MKLTGLQVVNFRNYSSCRLNFTKMINVFYGQNAQGKTNLLEAIFYAAFGLSHRTNAEDELIRLTQEAMAVIADFTDLHGSHELKIKRFTQQRRKKEILLDNCALKPKEHYGSMNVVMFSPEDLQLIKGEPALRRRFFDMQIAQTDPVYYDLLVKYNRVLSQRNRLLKEIRDNQATQAELQPWDKEFCGLATAITQKRLRALTKLQTIVARIYASLTKNKESLTVKYELKENNGRLLYPQEAAEIAVELYEQRLKERTPLDILRGNTGIGPHRDDLLLLLDNLSLRSFGSQGQQRSGALALKLSQLEYVRQEIGEYPLLLLDDVMSELDDQRRAQLLLFIDGRVQTFITVNDKKLIPELANNAYFRISNGTIYEEE